MSFPKEELYKLALRATVLVLVDCSGAEWFEDLSECKGFDPRSEKLALHQQPTGTCVALL